MITFKPEVRIKKDGPIKAVLSVLEAVARRRGYIKITSANDGRHRVGSAHYSDEAVDMSTKSRNEAELKSLIYDVYNTAKAMGVRLRIRVELNASRKMHYWYDPTLGFVFPEKGQMSETQHFHIELCHE